MKLSRRGIGMKGLGLSLALGAGLVGCAVLTVDVDVYKGALVNEEHVQLHQLTALATAAKPMLVGLRNDLEWPHDEGVPTEAHQKCSGHDQNWYEHGYIDEPVRSMPEKRWIAPPRHELPSTLSTDKEDVTCWKGFQNPMARRVNRILQLYENLGTEDLSFYAKKLLDAQAQAQAAESILKGGQERDEARAALIEKGFKSSLINTQEELKKAYMTLLRLDLNGKLGLPVRKAGGVMDALVLFGTRPSSDSIGTKSVEQRLIDLWNGADGYKDIKEIYEQRVPFRAVWKLLAEPENHPILAKATRELFKTDAQGTEAHKVLTEWVSELTEAYWDSQEAMHELWEVSLRVVIQLNLLEQKELDRHQALLDQAIDVVVRLTNLRHVASALHRVNSDEHCALLSQALTSGMTCGSAGADPPAMWTESAVLADPDRHEVLLRRTLSKAPADTAHFLLDLDHLEKGARPSDPKDNVHNLIQAANTVSAQHIARLGLNRDVVDQDGQDDYQRLIQELSRGLAGGFERGRLLYGLHTLTEKYLQAHDRATERRTSRNGADQAEADHERRLLDALVEFAEKVRFLANHEGLASPPVASGFIRGGAEKLTRGLLGDRIIDSTIGPLITDGLDESKKQRYIRVLQAVGNSILFSANELRERERHRDQGEKKVIAEVAAAKSVHSPDPAKVITDLLAELEHDKQAAQMKFDEASAQKGKLTEEIGSSTAPTTGLHAKKEKAERDIAQATQDLKDYRNRLDTLKAIHDVLTSAVIQQVKSQWQAGNPDPNNAGEFLNGTDGHSLKKKLENVRQSLNGTPNQEVVKRWADAMQRVDDGDTRTAFEGYRALKGLSSLKRLDLFDAFIAHLKELEAKRVKQVEEFENVQRETQDERTRILQKIDEAKKAVAALDAQIEVRGKGKLETAKREIGIIKAAVIKEVDRNRPYVFPQEVYAQIDIELKKSDTPDSKTAQEILASRVPPPGIPPLDPKDYKSPAEVMDGVIALLRYHQMEAVARFGKDSTQAEKATEAIENAYRHRAGMIYIRPSSAYLRTSFPSTSLQDDPNLAWDNMLLKQGLRNLPFSSELRDILNPSVKQDQVLTSELDKQYWQNINRVRVSGAGSTNQALVKDDVGNWYVKQYFGDTERIWESAKNLALFSMSAKVPIDLAKQLNKASKPEEYAENSKESPTLQKLLEKHQGAYKTHTDEVRAKLERLHTKNDKSELQETVIAAWEAHGDLKNESSFRGSLLTELKTEIRRWDQAAKDTAGQDPGQAIVKDVRALSRLDTLLAASITKMDATDKLKEAAKGEVHKIVGSQVTDILTDRSRALDQYEQAIVFIGDAANPKEAKPTDSNSETPKYEDARK